jgi:hypothetical protein
MYNSFKFVGWFNRFHSEVILYQTHSWTVDLRRSEKAADNAPPPQKKVLLPDNNAAYLFIRRNKPHPTTPKFISKLPRFNN